MRGLDSGKRIAANTLIVYARVFVTLLVGLLTSRLVLQTLGASDFGLYNAVGGVVAAFAVISGSLMTTTTRFINVELGRSDGNPGMVFSVSLVIHAVFAIIVFIVLEAAGIPYINHVLRVSSSQVDDAMFVFQVSVFAACVGLMNIPCQSLFVAKEKFVPIALIEIFNSLLRLALVLCLPIMPWQPLRMYAVIVSLTSIVLFVFYYMYASAHWADIVKFRFVRDRYMYKEIIVFNNYNMLSTAALMARTHGSNLLINYFFNTVTNAAYALSMMVQNYVNVFAANFDSATAPRITQSWSAGDRDLSVELTRRVCRLCTLLMIVVYFPLRAELEWVLHLWLGDAIPEGTAHLCAYSLFIAVVSATSGGLTHLINVYGRIKWFRIIYSLLYMSCIVLGYVCFSMGYEPFVILLLFVVVDLINRVVQLLLLRHYIDLDVAAFVMRVYGRPLTVALILLLAFVGYRNYLLGVVHPIAGIVLFVALAATVAFSIGLRSDERHVLLSFAMSRLRRNDTATSLFSMIQSDKRQDK